MPFRLAFRFLRLYVILRTILSSDSFMKHCDVELPYCAFVELKRIKIIVGVLSSSLFSRRTMEFFCVLFKSEMIMDCNFLWSFG